MEKCLMLVLVLVLVWTALSSAGHQVPDFCELFPSNGPGPTCYMYLPQFFYNSSSQDCEEFIYGGCGGNDNRFNSKTKCMETCSPRPALFREMTPQTFTGKPCICRRSHQKDNACNQPPEPGPCMGYSPQFFYNATSRECEIFIYGGCKGNANKFESLTSCQMNCRSVPAFNATEVCSLPPVTGPCKASFQKLYYNPQSQRCEPFIYGGCGGNDNRFDSIKDCMRICHPDGSDVITPLVSRPLIEPRGKPEACVMPPVTGPCRANIPRYFYNSTSLQCETFTYGGCGGNDNKFVSERECNLMCHHKVEQPTDSPGPDPTEICFLKPRTGPCQANIQRYYYNHKKQKCEEFNYGGCKGNRNNFVDEEACMMTCHKG